MALSEATLFEHFVEITDALWWFVDQHPFIGAFASVILIVTNWTIFRYHLAAMTEPDFMMKNLTIAGRFCRPTFEMWRNAAMSFAPLGLAVVCFSIVTLMRTPPFLAVFAIKGTGPIKNKIIAKALQKHTLFRFLKKLPKRAPKQKALE